MPTSKRILPLFALFALLLSALPLRAAEPRTQLKVATLAPEGSSWVKAIRAIDEQMRQHTDNEVGFKLYPGGVQGDEDVVLRKIRIGQLQGGGFGGQGVSQVFADVLGLEMPFLFESYDEIDYVLQKTEDFFHRGFAKNGFAFLGWVDIGYVYILSKHPIRGVEDIRGSKVWRLEGEPITGVLFRKAGVTSVPLNIPDVLLGLQTNLVDVVYASPSAAIAFQWFTRVKHITRLPVNYTLGAILIDQKSFSKLAPAHQQSLREIAALHLRQTSLRTRQENEEALQVMLGQGLQMVEPTPEGVATFERLVEEARPDLVGKAFSEESYELIQRHLREYRNPQGGVGP